MKKTNKQSKQNVALISQALELISPVQEEYDGLVNADYVQHKIIAATGNDGNDDWMVYIEPVAQYMESILADAKNVRCGTELSKALALAEQYSSSSK
jgi:hypothetical protein